MPGVPKEMMGMMENFVINYLSQKAKNISSLIKKMENINFEAKTEEDLKKLKSEIESNNGTCLIFKGDVSNEKDVKNAVEKTIEQFGIIDILINNAGFGIYKPVVELTVDEFDSMVGVNFRGVFLFTKYV